MNTNFQQHGTANLAMLSTAFANYEYERIGGVSFATEEF